MKIYILKTDDKFRNLCRKAYVFHSPGYTMETDFYDFITKSDLLTDDPYEADWHYLPIFWTHWHLNHDYARHGLEELQEEVNRSVLDEKKTFMVCQYDDGPQVDVGNIIQFNGAKRRDIGIDIPMLVLPHSIPDKLIEKKWLASFVGSFKTDPIRYEMEKALRDWDNVYITDSKKNKDLFVESILESLISLCPRGSAANSFRLFESMQLGVPPLYLGDIDARPFKKWIDWDSCSFYTDSIEGMIRLLEEVDIDSLGEMGKKAKEVWNNQLFNQHWCEYVLKELECL